ncbi:hypothetical protein ACF8PU_18730 [Pseudomonas sp. GLN_6]|uniref:hypothetical protein n=1 Tax=Pseudomonas sp. GLN_6 TaxID=3367183 RepID=UPI00370C0052
MKDLFHWIKIKITGKLMSKPAWSRPKRSRDFMALTVKLVLILLSMVALLATLYPLIDEDKITPTTASVTSIVGVVLLFLYGFLVFFEIYTAEGKRVFKQSDPDSIRNYMLHWIAYGGRVAIWTRDMSWAKDAESQELLREKARNDELIICLPVHTPFSVELEQAGAKIYVYGTELLSEPGARFTIAYYGRDGSKVAIGRARADQHIVEEFNSGSHPAFHLAHELVQIAKNVSSRKKEAQS